MTKKGEAKQPTKFREAARELGCDEDEAAFDEKLKRLGKHPPPEKPQPKTDKPDH